MVADLKQQVARLTAENAMLVRHREQIANRMFNAEQDLIRSQILAESLQVQLAEAKQPMVDG